MSFSPTPCQLNLALTLGVTSSLFFGLALNAMVTAQAFLVVGVKFVALGDRAATRMALRASPKNKDDDTPSVSARLSWHGVGEKLISANR